MNGRSSVSLPQKHPARRKMGYAQQKTRLILLVHLFSSFYNVLGAPNDSAIHSPPPIVDLGYAKYQGLSVVDSVNNKSNTNFLSIRYAAPPTGALRFAAPQAQEATAGVQMASAQPDRCWAATMGVQPASAFTNSTSTINSRSATRRANLESRAIPPSSEDCLFLK